jgi:hypothetical protein
MQLVCAKSRHKAVFLNQMTKDVTKEIHLQLDKRYSSFKLKLDLIF